MEMHFHYYDPAHPLKPYHSSLPSGFAGDLPEGCEPPDCTIAAAPRLGEDGKPLSGEWPVANAAFSGWGYAEDHRQRKDERDRVIEGTGTPYWLAAPHGEDDWQSEPRYMTDIGPLPKGATLTRPEKPQSEIANELRQQRDGRISSTQWLVERHADEVAAGGSTTLSADGYAALLTYRQTLRDMPKQAGFPWDGGGDATPWPVTPASARTA